MSYVYIIKPVACDGPCKVGISEDPHKRVLFLATGSPVPLHVAETYWFDTRLEAAAMEKEFHASYSDWRLHGEWFDIDFEDANFWMFENTIAEFVGYGDAPN